MSRLKLYFPQAIEPDTDDDGPVLLSFTSHRRRFENQWQNDVLSRAQLLSRNTCCPSCSRPTVEPVELADAIFNRNNLPIPGTATLVGFHCNHCSSEWPV